ncbi:hypothetical protein AZF37_07370 [endosymbiont 'TC1' of Trimyema compressum]|uniref:GntR family transcriptional regulator n=1 Tax=endosymbiont 'TC1' of Trimyema compressum TaxID=243899 RepID=UPI0007F0CBA1|nr:GntR family transcriptional regulator [endosymbiont 'TC1' of Trimyema compressum]AMP21003.1 hypothetical protein AZF37_07370 [endosymbiont 'TC1' of Trimyema compressum]
MDKRFLTKTEYVYMELKEKIGNGHFKKDEIYTVIDIAEQIGVSRTPVSGAIKILESEGYVVLYPGLGFKIKETSVAEARESLLISGALEKVAFNYLIENSVVNTKILKDLRALVAESAEAIKNGDREGCVASANAYHNNVYGLVDLPQVKKLLKDHAFLHENWYKSAVTYCSDRIVVLVEDHNKILDALGDNDLNQLNYIIKNHEEHCFEALKEVLLKGGIS